MPPFLYGIVKPDIRNLKQQGQALKFWQILLPSLTHYLLLIDLEVCSQHTGEYLRTQEVAPQPCSTLWSNIALKLLF